MLPQDKLIRSPPPDDQGSLRSKAEARLDHAPTEAPVRSAEELLHELRVYQIELEMQNETLRQSQITLEESRDRYVDFYDFAPVGYITLSREALITEINLTGATLLGEERRKLLRQRFAGFVAPEDRDLWHRHFMAVMQHNSKRICELKIQRGDGSRLHVQLDSLLLVKDGNAPVARIALTDITELKLMEDSLRESESRQRLLDQQKLVQTSLDGFWVVNSRDGSILEVNDIFCSMIGYSREELLTMSIRDLEAIETLEETETRIKKVLEIGYDRFETCQRHKQGHLINLDVSVSHSEINGGINYAFFRDITERKQIEKILLESESRFRTLFESATDCILILDKDGRIVDINSTGYERLGYEEQEMLGRRIEEFDIPEYAALVPDRLAKIAKEGKARFESAHVRKDGTVMPIEINSKIIYVGGEQRYFSVIRDITEQKRLEKEMHEHRYEMAYLQKLHIADQTAAAIAHELNQPLLAIASYSKAALMMIKAEKPDYDEICKAIEGSERQAQRAGQSMRELLEFLRMKEFPSETFDLNEVIYNILNAAKLEYELQFVSIFRVEEELPLVSANRTQVQKVLFNLLCNGIEAMQEFGEPLPAITVTVRTMKDENVAQVTIQDHGPGVKKENFHRLFEPFYTTKAKGIGMGLAVSRSLIEANGGQLWFDTQESSGATFHLTLPFAK